MQRWRNKSWGYIASAAIHGVVLALLHIHSEPMYVRPVSVARGQRGRSIVYLAKQGEKAKSIAPPVKAAKISLPTNRRPPLQVAEAIGAASATNDKDALRAGNPYGSNSEGVTAGADVRPALPIHFPDPAVPRSLLPEGVQGDVIIEVTIDTLGNVAETRLLRSFGYGIDERVVETVRGWRFRPATRDGVAIASKQDVHYHFPS